MRLLWWRCPAILKEVIINLTYDHEVAYQGVLFACNGAWLTFKSVSVLRGREQPAPMDGDMVVHREQIAFLQVVP